jgi:hypothetical protein
MLDQADLNLPIEIEFPGASLMRASETPHCITERQTAHGDWWRHRHSYDEPDDTLTAAIVIAAEVAADEARKSGKTNVVASTPEPSAAVYVFACDHPDASQADISIMYQPTPDRHCQVGSFGRAAAGCEA